MIKAIVSDFSRVLLFPKDEGYSDSLNALHKALSKKSNYNPLDYFELNMPLLRLYESLKNNTPVYIFTSDTIQDAPEFQQYLQPVFKDILSAKKMNTDKKFPEAYQLVAQHLKVNLDEVLYIDDSPDNLQAAKSVGCKTILYNNFDELRSKIAEELNFN